MKLAAAGSLLSAAGLLPRAASAQTKLSNVSKSGYSTNEPATAYKHVTGYNNYYEFGTDKEDPPRHAKRLKVRPWTVAVEGEVAKPRTFGIEDLLMFSARGAGVPPALRGGVVHGDSLGGLRIQPA